MSLLFKTDNFQENLIRKKKLFNITSNTKQNYLWSEINNKSNQKFIKDNTTFSDQYFSSIIPEPKSILDSKFYLLQKIGQGSSAKVYLGISKDSLVDNCASNQIKYYSIKIMDPQKTDLNIFKTEVKLLERINHDNILKIFAYGKGPKKSCNKNKNKDPKEFYYIVMEYLEHDELLKYITSVIPGENIGFGEDFSRLIFAELLNGLEAMHNLNIFHRDIKPNNIMIGGDNYKLKYVDFGFGTDENRHLNSFLGTPNYAAPELHLKRPYFGKSEDIFSLGITLFVLVTGCLPFKMAVPNDSFYQYFVKSDYVEFWRKRMVNVSPSFMELFDNMVAFDYSQRPSISEIRESTWMKEINWDLLPYLKQEFILREEKIKNNKEQSKNILKQEIKNQSEKPVFSLLETKKQIRNNGFTKENINNINLINNNTNENTNNKNSNNKNNVKEYKGMIKLKIKSKNLNKIIIKVKKNLKKKGYVPIYHDCNKFEMEVTDGEVDILIKLERNISGFILLKYFKLNGLLENFNLFKKEINLIKAKYC